MSDLQCPVRVYAVLDDLADHVPPGVRVADVITWRTPEPGDVRAAFDDLAPVLDASRTEGYEA